MRTLTQTEVLLPTLALRHTEAIETDISSDAAVAYKEISQSEELVLARKRQRRNSHSL